MKVNFHGGGTIDPNLKTLSVETFSNESAIIVPTLSQDFTEAIRDRFLSQSRLSLTNGSADVEVSGSIYDYSIRPTSITGDETAAQNQLTIAVKVSFTNNVNTNESWEKTFSSTSTPFSSSLDFNSIEGDIITEVIEQLTQDIFNQSLGKW